MIEQYRIGNLIADVDFPENGLYFKVEQIVDKYGTLGLTYRNGSCWTSEPNPIKLTEEILLKLWFVKMGECFYSGMITGKIDIKSKKLTYVNQEVKMEYLHTLQNYYHSVTGEELNITPLLT